MDIGSLPDLANHFFAAAQIIMPVLHHGVDACMNACGNVWTGLTVGDAMDAGSRSFQLLKIAGSTFGLALSVMGESVEGVMGCAISDGEALMELARAGQQYRALHPGG